MEAVLGELERGETEAKERLRQRGRLRSVSLRV
jgi:hypothetical protein